MEHKKQAVIFDMYETLVTQFCSPLYYGAEIAQDLGLNPKDFVPKWRKFADDRTTGKLSFEEVIEILLREYNICSLENFKKIVDKRIAIQSDCFTHLHPQILPMMSKLKKSGIKIGLVSNCFSEEAMLIKKSKLFPLFDALCLSYELGVQKPDPAIYHKCIELLGVSAENCLYVGDGGSQELETAQSLGMQALQATWYRKDDFEKYQEAIRSEFPQINEPIQVLSFVRK